MAGEAENGFRKLCAEHAKDGLVCSSAGPVARPGGDLDEGRDRGAAGQGDAADDLGADPEAEHPNFKDGENFYPDLTDNFFTANAFPPCGVNLKAPEIMARPRTISSN